MTKVSKKFGLAFKAAGLFAVGLFAAVLKGGPVTSKLLGTVWESIGYVMDTLAEMAGAWDWLIGATKGLNEFNTLLREMGLAAAVEDVVLKVFWEFPIQTLSGWLEGQELEMTWSGILTGILNLHEEHWEKVLGVSVIGAGILVAETSRLMQEMRDDINEKFVILGDWIIKTWDETIEDLKLKFTEFETWFNNKISALWDLLKRLKRGITSRAADLGDIILGKKAAGGPVSGGQSDIVGERGPGVFTPASSGKITSNRASGFGGGDTVVKLEINLDGRRLWEGIKRVNSSDLRRMGA